MEIRKPRNLTSLIVSLNGGIEYQGYEIKETEVLVIGSNEERIILSTNAESRFLYISGKKTNESIAWYRPIVMNTWDQM